jgi:hypothetical protein
MTTKIRSLFREFRELHEDEAGMEAIQVVAIFAIAAIVLIFVKTVIWPKVQQFSQSKVSELTSD